MAIPCVGVASVPAPLAAGEKQPLPLSLATGGVRVDTSGSTGAKPNPTSKIYSGNGDIFSLIPAAALPGSLTLVYAHLQETALAAYWIQLHRDNAEPPAGAIPEQVGATITAPGGNTQFSFPQGVERDATGYVVVLSTTQDTYTSPNVPELMTRAYGQVP